MALTLKELSRKLVDYRLLSRPALKALLARYSISTSTELLQLLRHQAAKGILSEPITEYQLSALIANRDADLVIRENGKAQYLLRENIGEGSFGKVFHGTDLSSKKKVRDVAVKQVYLADKIHADRFDREVKALQAISGKPHLASYISHGKITSDLNYLVMNFVQGPKLSDVIQASQAFAIPAISMMQLSIWVQQMVAGLKTLHEADVVHRDIKPDNIILNRQDQSLCIVDFGLARHLTKDTRFTLPGAMGTFEYMPLEMFDNSLEPQKSSDIYSLGAVLYEMLTGVYPSYPVFPSSELISWEQACQRDFQPPSFYRPRLSPEWDALVMKCLKRKPEERFQHAGEFEEHLLLVLRQLQTPIPVRNLAHMLVRQHCVELRSQLVSYVNGLKRGDLTAAVDKTYFWESFLNDYLARPIDTFLAEMKQLEGLLSPGGLRHYQKLGASCSDFLQRWKDSCASWDNWSSVTRDLSVVLYTTLTNAIIIPTIQMQFIEE